MTKPTTADGYTPEILEVMRSTCLTLATVLGDLMDDIVVVGGLVPSFLLPTTVPPEDPYGPHVGTADVDVAFAVSLLDAERYKEIAARLRRAGFGPDTNESGNTTRHRWIIARRDRTATVEFLIEPLGAGKAGRIQSLEKDIAAIMMRGMHLAFQEPEPGGMVRKERERRIRAAVGAKVRSVRQQIRR